jgi:hypothetical protein
MRIRIAMLASTVLLASTALAQDALNFAAISARHAGARMSDADLARARAEGECLAGIRVLGALPKADFQPNIEWLNFRTQALLTVSKPCEVLVMLEAAHDALMTSNAPGLKN